jgi:hypothetical protein
MKVLIAGSRTFNDYDLLQRTFLERYILSEVQEIISGGAKGADELGEALAKDMNIPVTRFPAQWGTYGKKAGMLRNLDMAEYCTHALIFWDGESKGTEHMIDSILKIKKPLVKIVYTELTEDEEW